MPDYDIYAIGAALVDTEVEVTDNFLAEHSIDKGVMTLVGQPRQSELISSLKKHGSTLLKQSGGSACNSVVAAAQLGSKTYFGGKVAADDDGKLYAQDLTQASVSHAFTPADQGVTGKCLVMVTSDAERTMNTYLGVSDEFAETEINQSVLAKSDWFYVEGYLQTDDHRTAVVKSAVEFAKQQGVKVGLSLSDPFVAQLFSDNLRSVIGDGVDLIFCNKDEALAFTGADTIEQAVETLKSYTKTSVITDGANGATVFDGDSLSRVPGVKAKAIDTNGAGDMFAGAFLYAITSGKSYQKAAQLANQAAAKVVERFGPRLDKADFESLKIN
ncbi:MAG: adenosine kinase [Porticoccaceae bacterium]